MMVQSVMISVFRFDSTRPIRTSGGLPCSKVTE